MSENVIRHTDNYVKKMEVFYVAIAIDKGMEGALAQLDTSKIIPVVKGMCGATTADLEHIKTYCQQAADEAGAKVQILKFSRREVLAEYLPRKK